MKDELERITPALFEEDSYTSCFTATVTKCSPVRYKERDCFAVVLDRTYFFPEGGGQTSDTGKIDEKEVFDVQTVEGEIVHYAAEPVAEGATVNCLLDFEKRFRKMQAHSAEHLFCGLVHNRFGYENVGFHLADDIVTFDVSGVLEADELFAIEKEANDIIYRNVPITVSFPSKEELQTIAYRSKLEFSGQVRLVTIEGYDVCACCAPHVKSTAEIGVLKITDFFPHRGGTRITLIAGAGAYEDYYLLDRNNRAIMKLLSSKREETPAVLERYMERTAALTQENLELKKKLTDIITKSTMAKLQERIDAGDDRPFVICPEALDDVGMRNLINRCCTLPFAGIVIGFLGDDTAGYRYIASPGSARNANAVPLQEFAKELNGALNGRGGGNSQMVSGRAACKKADIEKFIGK